MIWKMVRRLLLTIAGSLNIIIITGHVNLLGNGSLRFLIFNNDSLKKRL